MKIRHRFAVAAILATGCVGLHQSASADPAFSLAERVVESALPHPQMCAYLSLQNKNICIVEMSSGNRYLQIKNAHWISTKPARLYFTYDHIPIVLVNSSSEFDWKGTQAFVEDKTNRLFERTYEVTVTKVGEDYHGKLFVNGESWNGWDGYFVFKRM